MKKKISDNLYVLVALVPLAACVLALSFVTCRGAGEPGADMSGQAAAPRAGMAEDEPGAAVIPEELVRPAVLAGSWYLKDPVKLRNRLNQYLERAGKIEAKSRPVALISPHAGYRYSGQAAAYGYKALKGWDIRRVILLGVSHGYPYMGASIADVEYYLTPLGRAQLDVEAVEVLRKSPLFGHRRQVHRREHSVEIQIPMLQAALEGQDFTIVPIVFGALKEKHYPEIAAQLKKIMDDKTVVVASSDFMHYGERFGYLPFHAQVPKRIEETDRKAIDRILAKDFDGFWDHYERTGNTICGRVPIGVLLKLLPEGARGMLLRYYRSGDMSGEWHGSVSYADILFTEGKGPKGAPPVRITGSERQTREAAMLTRKEQAEVLALAKETVSAFVSAGKVPDANALSAAVEAGLKKERGVFVTLRRHGRLRGCIGSIVGTEPLFRGVIRNAISASAHDRRFNPVQPAELKDITVEVSVLSPLTKVDTYEEILPGWHGIVLKMDGRSSVYLPQVLVETGWPLEQALTQLSKKAGLGPNDWRIGAEFHVFEAQIIPE